MSELYKRLSCEKFKIGIRFICKVTCNVVLETDAGGTITGLLAKFCTEAS
jgi:hypothetical protein